MAFVQRGQKTLQSTDHFSVCREIVDNHEKENALNVVTEERTYHIYAESPEDARYIITQMLLFLRWAL